MVGRVGRVIIPLYLVIRVFRRGLVVVIRSKGEVLVLVKKTSGVGFSNGLTDGEVGILFS